MNLDQQQEQDKTVQEVQFPKSKRALPPIPRPHLGMFLFGVDMKTGVAEQIVTKVGTLPVVNAPHPQISKRHIQLPKQEVHNQVKVQINLWYCWAINKTNAEKKFRKAVKTHKQRRHGK